MHIALLCLLAIAVGNVLSLLLPKRTVSPELLHLASDFKLPTEDQKPSDHCITCLGGCLDRAGLHNWVSGVTVVPQSALTSFKLCGLECSMNGHCAEGPGGPPIEVDRIFSRQRALGLMEATTEEISILPAIFEQQ